MQKLFAGEGGEVIGAYRMNAGINKVKRFQEQGYKIYVYGVGLWGRNVYHELLNNGININGFVVTKIDNMKTLFELPISEYFELKHNKSVLILGLNQHNTKEVCTFLEQHRFNKNRIVYSDDIMGVSDIRCGYDEVPCLDITTKIGCNVNCKYCPQDVLLRSYFMDNPGRENYLCMDTLMKCIEHMPDNASYQFGGMAEPFLNPDCLEMIRFICDGKHRVNLYTTLVGLNEEILYKVMDLPIEYVTLHVADNMGYAQISTTDEYYHLLEIAVNYKKKDGKRFVDMCNAQAEPDKHVAEICKGKYIIPSTLIDRAGNLEGENLVSKRLETGKISCGVCGRALNKNELLPDGTLLLCCMDYGMKHVLGNLKEQSYAEIMSGTEIEQIKRSMESDFKKDILCRVCSCANLVD